MVQMNATEIIKHQRLAAIRGNCGNKCVSMCPYSPEDNDAPRWQTIAERWYGKCVAAVAAVEEESTVHEASPLCSLVPLPAEVFLVLWRPPRPPLKWLLVVHESLLRLCCCCNSCTPMQLRQKHDSCRGAGIASLHLEVYMFLQRNKTPI